MFNSMQQSIQKILQSHSKKLFVRHHNIQTPKPRTMKRTKSWIADPGPRITLIGSLANVGLVAGKSVAGVLSGSSAMVADAAHSLGDLVSDAVALGALRLASKPPDEDHPYGHGKYEEVGALVVSVLLCGTGCGVGFHSLELMQSLYHTTESISSISGSGIGSGGNSIDDAAAAATAATVSATKSTYFALAGAVAAISIGTKETLYRYTKKVGTEVGSPVIIANAHHHRSDAYSSVVALGGIGGAMAGLPWLDPVAGTIVSVMIVKSSFDIGWDAILSLTDTADLKLQNVISNQVDAFVLEQRGVTSFSHVRARRIGSDALVDLNIVVEPMLTVSAAHVLAELVRHRIITNIKEVVDVTVHVDPEIGENEQTQFKLLQIVSNPLEIEKDVRQSLMMDRVKYGILSVTHVGVHVLASKVRVEVCVEINPNYTVRKASEIASECRRKLEQLNGIDDADIHLELDDGGDDLRKLRDIKWTDDRRQHEKDKRAKKKNEET